MRERQRRWPPAHSFFSFSSIALHYLSFEIPPPASDVRRDPLQETGSGFWQFTANLLPLNLAQRITLKNAHCHCPARARLLAFDVGVGAGALLLLDRTYSGQYGKLIGALLCGCTVSYCAAGITA